MLTAIERDMVIAADGAKLQRARVCLVMCESSRRVDKCSYEYLIQAKVLSCRHLCSKLNNGLEMIASDDSMPNGAYGVILILQLCTSMYVHRYMQASALRAPLWSHQRTPSPAWP